ncbi:glycine C-acetyltransferase [Thermanaerothrix sp. 4228-RoL]|jgi:glycine C-acetyltransferase|uniref:8-amino-7-ketopelargonate synthase n=1 Tax=Thermanaerothrix solaris TaxID=3058434 RepID=A0ABU3NNY5_9CHLR|nr:glycine C-acetyltransferase [Thermanaerothrix sp. 4228-RoL]MDT8898550.1 glycine C-acetyltransferase [Thermanaerothrix sp. 4228-RoL]
MTSHEVHISKRLAWIQDELETLKASGLYNTIRTISSAQGAWLEVDGRRVLNFCSNNYLGLANHPRLVAAAREVLARYGVGPAAVRSIAGTLDLHLELERRLAAFKRVEAAVTFQSGFCANLAAIPALVGKEDVIFSDELNHASIIDGCRLSGARIVRYAHCDPNDLEQKIQEAQGTYRRGLVVTDGVFSMDGDVAPLDQIYAISSKYDLMLMVDDAHGEGVLGEGGRGIVDHFGLHGKVDVEVGTFSKAFGVVGGAVAGSSLVVEWLRQRGRPFLFSSAVPAADVAATIAAIDVLEESTELVDRLWENARYFKAEMRRLGFDTGQSVTPITPIMLGEAPLAQQFSRELFSEGVFAMAIGYPTVPKGKARIRVMLSAAHSREDLDRGLEAFARVGKRLGVIAG